jgi:NAD(P)-dependent dehydrogenase (short-subunit alcohol dehydrogenase family)/3-oxoacyl-(acyl-carrier-protein) synthase
MQDLQGKLALVTGGAKGVGKVIAARLAERGAHVLINFFHSLDAAKQTKAELEAQGARVDIIRASVALEAQVDRMFDQIEAEYGYLDILINNAAAGTFTALDDVDGAAFDRSLDTNLKGSFWCARRAARLMERHGGGVIVNLSSIGAVQVAADYVTVGTSKAAVESLTRYLAYELGPKQIRVNTASAGLLENEVGRRFPRYEEMRRNIIAATPLGRIGTEEELADLVLFLASDQSRYITGQMILADGGMSLGGSILSPRAEGPALAEGQVAVEAPAVAEALAVGETVTPGTEAPTEVDDDSEEIAVVGMGMVVPGANSPDEFWQVLTDGPDLLRYVPRERWENRSFYSADGNAEDKTYQNTSGFITHFKPAPALAAEADANEQSTELTTLWLRHSLYQALDGVKREVADRYSFVVGYTPDGNQHLEESMVIASTMHHLEQTLAGAPGSEAFLKQARAALEQEYWRGAFDPSALLPHQVGRKAMDGILPEQTELLMVDTACSSSLYAVDIGIKGLLTGKHDIAVCGGSFALGPRSSVLFAKLHGLSTSGQVRPLDKQADGVLFSDGSGVVVLKKLSRAKKDGDRILGVIRGLGTSSDGKGRAIYAPSPDGQGIAIDRALAQPAVDLDRVDWVVAHATGTPAGDLTEFTALRERLKADHPIHVTSNKSLIGHTGWAAGVASLIQVLLALRHGVIPPQHHFTSPPDLFQMDGSNMRIPTSPVAWKPRPESPRAAAVSGFGFGGTNAHVVVEEYQPGARAVTAAPERAYNERIAVVGWAAHVPGLETSADVTAWLTGKGKAPLASFGEFYPAPSFQKVKMPPRTVRTIDRCQLMILECAHALRNQLGQFWEAQRETTGVVLGHMGLTRHSTLYGTRCYLDDIERVLRGAVQSPLLETGLKGLRQEVQRLVPASNEDSFPGIMPNVIPARVANYFDLKGANMALDTGIASSVSALEVASRYLRSREMSMVLAGGVNGNSTPETVAAIRQHLKDTGVEIAEGCFLFALVTESTAKAAGLPVLGFLDEGAGAGAQVACGVGADRRTYMGAEGALGLLRALVTAEAEPEVTVACRTEAETYNLTVSRPGAPGGSRRGAEVEVAEVSRPGSRAEAAQAAPAALTAPQVQRYESFLAPVAGEAVRTEIPFLSPDTAIVTDRPDLLPADTRGALIITPDTDPGVIQARPHLRVLTTLDEANLTRLHDLTFLALKQSFGGLQSFIGLFPGVAGHPMTGLYTGLFKSAALELPSCVTAAIFTDTADMQQAIAIAQRESSYKQMLPYVRYEGGVRKTQLVRQSAGELAAEAPLGPDSVVVATAGARGITAELLKAVAREYKPHLFLIGSNDLDRYPAEVFQGTDAEFSARRAAYLKEQKALHPQKSIGQLNKEFDRMAEARQARRNIEEMERHSGKGKVRYYACNVLDRGALTTTINKITREAGRPVDLLVNAAGLNRSASIPAKSLSDFQTIREIKLQGYLNLKHAFAGQLPRIWCNFGSFIGLTGQLGETDYAAGNDFLATAAAHAQAQGHDEFTIGWTLWKTVGMGANPVTRAFLEKSAVFTSMETEEGIAHFLRELRLKGRAPATFHLGEAERNAVTAAIPEYFAVSAIPVAGATPNTNGTFYLGRELRRTTDDVLFERIFDLEKDAYLQHHVVNGYATLPGTFVPELAAEAASSLLPGHHVIAFEDAVFHHFLRVYDKSKPSAKKIHAKVISRDNDQTRVQVRITTDVVAPNGTILTKDKLHFEIKVILTETAPVAPTWTHWDSAGEELLPDPYHFPKAPVLLTDLFVSTEKTRRHPLGKRATYKLGLSPNHPVFSIFLVPSILLDGLARVAVLEPTENDYMPIAAPASIRRIDLFEVGSDCQVAQRYQPVEFYATPAHIDLEKPESNRFVAVRPDGRILLQMKDVRGVIIGYVHRTTGDFVSPQQMDELRRKTALLKG